jgi:hypothetical protein
MGKRFVLFGFLFRASSMIFYLTSFFFWCWRLLACFTVSADLTYRIGVAAEVLFRETYAEYF